MAFLFCIYIKIAGIVSGNRVPVDLFQIVDHESSQFSKGSTNPTNPTNPHESLVLYTNRILTNNPQIQIRESDSMALFRVVIAKSNLVYTHIRICKSGHFKKVQLVSIWEDSCTILNLYAVFGKNPFNYCS